MEFLTFVVTVTFIFTACSRAEAYKFFAGGRDGWVIHPAEDYTRWSGRNRFLINDTIYFKYKKGEDSVLLVTAEDYSSCNTNNPIKKWDDGDTLFQFDRSGPFYFISGRDGNCQQGQKLIVVVLAVRRPPESAPPPEAPEASPPTVSESPTSSSVPPPSTSTSPTSSIPSSISPSDSVTAAPPASDNPSGTSPPPLNSSASMVGFPSLWASVAAGVVVLFVGNFNGNFGSQQLIYIFHLL